MSISLLRANSVIERILAKGRDLGCAPLTVAVLDPGGHLVSFQREDGSGILRPQIAIGKAWGALGMGFGSRELRNRADKSPQFVNSLAVISDGRVVPGPGGVIIRAAGGELQGAVGVSGDTSDNDEICAIAGIEAVGFIAQPGASESLGLLGRHP